MKNLVTLSALIMAVYAEDTPKCNDRQILSNGECQNCPTWTRAQENHSYCNSDQCNLKTQVVKSDGSCDTCPEGYEPDVNMVDCNKIGLSCEGNTAKSGDDCKECPMYTKPQSGNSYCSPDYCDDNSIILPSGDCKKCDEGSKPDLIWRRECVVDKRNQVCDGRQIELMDHAGLTTCQDCPDFTRAQFNNWYCAADLCDFNQIVQKDGTCLSCPRNEQPDSSRMKCNPIPAGFTDQILLQPTEEPQAAPEAQPAQTETKTAAGCEPSWQITTEDGKCVACPEFTRPQSDGNCGPDMCNRTEFLHEWGYCLPCEKGKVHDKTGRQCEFPGGNLFANFQPVTCGEREHRSIDGLECYDCPDYTRSQNNGAKCAGDQCEQNQILNVNGTCSPCPDGTRPNFMQRNCVKVVTNSMCSDRQIYVEVMNMCEDCPDYTKPRGDFCAADSCASNEKLQSDGSCKAVECGELEILGQDGTTCEKCFPYTRPQDNGTRCGQDDCPKGIIQFDGTCQNYGDYYTNLKVVKNPNGDGVVVEKEESSSSAPIVVIGILAAVILGLVAFILFKFRGDEKQLQSQNHHNVVEMNSARSQAAPQNGPTEKKLNTDEEFDKIDAEVPQEQVKDSIQAPIASNQ